MSSNRPAQRLLIEAMTAGSELISEDIRQNFLVIGGAALTQYGSNRYTRDIDIAITPETLLAFHEKASNDTRFHTDPDGRWVYTCQGQGIEGLTVEFEFLTIGGAFVPKLHGMTKFNHVWVASLPDIAVMKASTFRDRGENHDYFDLIYALRMMARKKQTLAQYRIKETEIATIRSAVAGNDEDEALLSQVTG